MMRAKYVASCMRTGAGEFNNPAWSAVRRQLFMHQWNEQGAFNQAARLLRTLGFSKLMAYEIAVQFLNQCEARGFLGGAK